jgi:hypothetical protein
MAVSRIIGGVSFAPTSCNLLQKTCFVIGKLKLARRQHGIHLYFSCLEITACILAFTLSKFGPNEYNRLKAHCSPVSESQMSETLA